jgi:MSHA biogenesis protein MshQ
MTRCNRQSGGFHLTGPAQSRNRPCRRLRAVILFMAVIAPAAWSAVTLRGATQNAVGTLPSAGVTYVGAGGTASRNTCGSINPSIPAGTSGDLLIAVVITKESDTSVSMNGWNTYYSATYPTPSNNNQELQAYIFWRFADGSGINTITQSGTCDNMAAQIARFSGVNSASPFETGAPGVVAQDSDNIDTGTINTTTASAMALVADFVSSSRTVTPDPGWNQAFNFAIDQGGSKPDLALSLHYQTQTTAGTKSISDWALSSGGINENFGVMLALTPAVPVAGLTINVPAGTTAGDVMIAAVAVLPSAVTITPPAGWTSLNRVDQTAGNSNSQEIFYRIATAAEPASYTWTFSGAIGGAAGGMLSYSGVDTTGPVDVYGGNPTPSSTSHTASSVTTTVDNAMVISSHSFSSAETWTPPAGMAEEVDAASLTTPNAAGISLEINDVTQATAGATGDKTATAGGNADTGVAQLLALKPARALAEWRMDETSWSGNPGEVIDQSGNGFNGTALNSAQTDNTAPAISGNPGTCGYATFPANTTATPPDAVATALNPSADVGNAGSITFWYYSNAAWNGGGNRQLLDASNATSGKYFFLTLNSSGRLRFGYQDSTNSNLRIDSPRQSFTAGQWVHVTVTWDLPNNSQQIYINGSLAASGTVATSGVLGQTNLLYLGDNNGENITGGATADSADGGMDEVRVYNTVLTPAQIAVIMNETHPCAVVDHYVISHSGTGVTCLSEAVTVTAIDTSGNPIDPGNVTINLSVVPVAGDAVMPPAKGDWVRVVPAVGTLSNSVNNGTADYTFPGDGTSSVTFIFNYTRLETGNTTETINFNVDDVSNGVADTRDGAPATDPDLVMTLTGFQFYNETAGNAMIPAQIAGKPSAVAPNNAVIALRAVRASDSDPSVCVAAFPDMSTVTVPLGAECRNPGTCAGRQLTVTNNAATTAVATSADNGAAGAAAYTGVNLLFQDDGTGITRALLELAYPDAGQMQLHAYYEIPLDQGGTPPTGPGSGGFMSGSSNPFVVKPFGFAIGSVQDTGGGANPGTDTPGGALFVTAGTDFRATVTAYNWDAADDDGSTCNLASNPGCAANDGIPDTNANLLDNNGGGAAAVTPNYQGGGAVAVTLTPSAPYAPSTGVGGTLGQLLDSTTGAVPVIAAAAFSGGSAALATLQYLQAGSMTLKADVADYLGAGPVSGRSSNLGSNPNNGVVGRFGADHFIFTANTPQLGPACGTFTYVDQPFTYTTAPQITAKAVAADGVTVLTNYADFSTAGGADWWLLNRAPVSGGGGVDMAYTDLAGPTDIQLDSTVAGYTPNSGTTGSNGQQLFSLVGPFAYARKAPPVSPQPPFNGSLRLDFSVTDSDGATGTYTINPITFTNPQMRWGRLALINASGSERLDLTVPLRAEYWNGYAFVTNSADNCTVIENLASDILLTNPDTASGAPQPGNTAMVINDGTTQVTSGPPALVSGAADITFSAPYDGDAIPDTGYVDIEINLSIDTGSGGSDDPWLQYDWNGDGSFIDNPTGRATFGIYHGGDNLIYMREPWN